MFWTSPPSSRGRSCAGTSPPGPGSSRWWLPAGIRASTGITSTCWTGQSVRLLLEAVYEPHWQRYSQEFGKTLAGFFSDEPNLGNGPTYTKGNTLGCGQDLPWSRELESALEESWGPGWRRELPRLFSPGRQRGNGPVPHGLHGFGDKAGAGGLQPAGGGLVPSAGGGVHRPRHRGRRPALPHRLQPGALLSGGSRARTWRASTTSAARCCPRGRMVPP